MRLPHISRPVVGVVLLIITVVLCILNILFFFSKSILSSSLNDELYLGVQSLSLFNNHPPSTTSDLWDVTASSYTPSPFLCHLACGFCFFFCFCLCLCMQIFVSVSGCYIVYSFLVLFHLCGKCLNPGDSLFARSEYRAHARKILLKVDQSMPSPRCFFFFGTHTLTHTHLDFCRPSIRGDRFPARGVLCL